MNEREIAIMEANMFESEAAYFEARNHLDTHEKRVIFCAGFKRAWEKTALKYPDGLPDNMIAEIGRSMEGGMDGFMKGWGWVQFVRAIEKAHGIGE